ncbi:MAG: fibronectin type III domain-containing protein, partial [Gemmatimonadota bacterium]|nr:fibronectin type III domain-containing protein [Gemmatimonadota bacterium]
MVANLTGVADGDSAILVTWDPPADTGSSAITGYEVGVSPNEVSWTYDTIPADSTAFREAGLDANTTRHYRITAQNASGNGAASTITAKTDAGRVPGPPRNLVATPDGDSAIDLSWDPPADSGSSAVVEYAIDVSSDNGQTFDQLADISGSKTTYKATGLDPGTTRHYRVAALNSFGYGPWSDTAGATTAGATGTPGPPTDLTATASSTEDSVIELEWNAPADTGSSALTWYRIEGSEDGGSNWSYAAFVDAASTTHRHTRLEPGTRWTYRVSAQNSDGVGAPSNFASAIAGGATGAPGPPTDLQAQAVGDSAIALEWNAPADTGSSAVVGYRLEGSRDGGSNWTYVVHISASFTTHIHAGLEPGTTWSYRVSAQNSDGIGAPSNIASATVSSGTGPPGPPTDLQAEAEGDSVIELEWRAPADTGSSAVFRYRIEGSQDGGSSWTYSVHVSAAFTHYRHTGLQPGTRWTYRVSAQNSEGFGAPSNTASATAGGETGVPGPPTDLQADAAGDSAIQLEWQAPADTGSSALTTYRIEGSRDGGSSWTHSVHSNAVFTDYRHTKLEPGTTWTYRVSAQNSDGVSEPSDTASATVGAGTVPPGAVANLEGVADGDSAILVTWDPPADTGSSAITGYEVGVSPNEVSWTYDTIPADSTAFREAGLDANTTRHYRITAQNASGNGSTSSVSVTTAGAPPGPPTDLTATASATEDSVIELAWKAPADTGSSALTTYRIEGSRDGGSSWTYAAHISAVFTAHRHSGLEPGTTWTYRVSARNSEGLGVPSSIASATVGGGDPGVPGIPTGLAATADGRTAIGLSWTAPADSGTSAITGYRIEVSSNRGVSWANLVSNTNSTSTTYRHTGLAPGTTRHYRVSAINTAGPGPPSNVANATTRGSGVTVPDAPTDLEADAAGDRVDLDWNSPDFDGGSAITGYRIEYSTDGDDWDDLEEDTETTSTRYRHQGIEPGTRYYYRVRAINAVGESAPSNEASATTGVGVPGAPTDLEADADGPTEVELDWEAPASDGGSPVTGYRIEYSEDGDDWDDLEEDTESTSTRYVHRGADPGTRYHYRVRAINAAGESEPSNEASATTETSEPDAPTGLVARAVDEGRIDLSWTAPEFDGGSAVTGYRIEVSYGDVNWEVLTENTQSTATSYTHTGLDPNTEATYRVAAVNAQGHGGYSNTATARTDATVAGAPRGLNARPVGTDRIDLSWTPPLNDGGSEIEGYRILVAGPTGGFTALVNHTGTTATTYSHSGLDPGTRQRYQVQAINDAGMGPSSNIASARTDPVVADAPVNLVAGAQGSNAIVVTWEPPAYTGGVEIEGYRIEVHDGSEWAVLVDDHGLSTTYTHSGLEPGDERRYRVYALNEAGASEASNVAVAATDPVIPDPPSELEAKANGPYRIDLEWRAPGYDGGADITGYRIHVLADGESEWRVLEEDTRTGETRYAHTGLEPATENRYRVAAINAAGVSHLSAPAAARTDPVVPDPPENLRAEA